MNIAERILAEYRELPGLRLTTRQAARLWKMPPVDCERLLDRLVTDGHLRIDAKGQYASRREFHDGGRPRGRPFRSFGAGALARRLTR